MNNSKGRDRGLDHLRDRFAEQALVALLLADGRILPIGDLAQHCYAIADALLVARETPSVGVTVAAVDPVAGVATA